MRIFVAVALMVLAMGCGTFVTDTRINPSPRPLRARAPATVEVYASSPPVRPHVDIALLEVQQTRGLNPQGTALMIENLRERAGALGCDALFLGGMSDHQGADPGSGFDLIDPGATIRQATCIVYSDESVADAQAPSPARDGGQPPPQR
jgi:hypothetical protein